MFHTQSRNQSTLQMDRTIIYIRAPFEDKTFCKRSTNHLVILEKKYFSEDHPSLGGGNTCRGFDERHDIG